MTAFLSDLFGLSAQSDIALRVTKWIDDYLPLPGASGVPDLLTQPQQCAAYLNGVRDIITESNKQRPLLRLADSNLKVMQEIRGEISASVEELMADTGKVTLKIHYDNWLVDYMIHQTMGVTDLHLLVDPIPTKQNWRTRWGGKITEIHIRKTESGEHEIELTALSFFEHCKRLLAGANPLFPPEIQLPRMWVLPGPTRTIIMATMFVNLARIFMPGWSTIDNIANPGAWINPVGPDAVLNLLPTEWPIQVAFVDPVLDQSRWSSIGAAWTPWFETFKDLLTDAGCMMRWYTYLTTDEDSPNVELASILNLAPDLLSGILGGNSLSEVDTTLDKLVAPQRNCAIVGLIDVSGQTGPTGTAVDGLIDTIAVTLDDLITPIAINLSTGETYDPGQVLNGEPVEDASGLDRTYLLEQLFGVAPSIPNVIWWDGNFNGMFTSDLTWHKGTVKTIMTGSKSPTIVNEAQTFAIRYGLSQLQIVLTTGLFENVGSAPVGAGLDSLYQGQLDNTLLAWERFTDPIRALNAGDLAWQEHFEKGSGTAYTLASILTLRSGDWKTREWASFKAVPDDGHPWIAEIDYQLGDRIGFENDGVIYVDNVTSIKREWDWSKPVKVTINIGSDAEKSDPFNAAFKTIAAVYSLVGQLAGEGTLFG